MIDRVEQHFVQHLGAWIKRSEYARTAPNEPSVWVYEWKRISHAMSTFATVGYSRIPLPQTGDHHRLEFMFNARGMSFDEAADVLLKACATPLDDILPLRTGHSIGPLRTPLGAGMSRLYLTEPWEQEPFDKIELNDLHAQILMLVPLYESELRFIRTAGEEAFWDAFEAAALDIVDLRRPALHIADAPN
jgi:hypothetical protein